MEMETELIPGLPDCVALHCLLRLPFRAILAARAVCRRWKHELSSSSFYRIRSAAAADYAHPIVTLVLRSKLLSTVGVLHVVLYEPLTGVFTMRQLAANRPNDKIGYSNAIVIGRELVVVVGGWDEFARCTGEVHIYDLLSGAWRPGAPMPISTDLSFYMWDIYRGKVFMIGRRNDENKNILAYDVATDIWLELPEMTMRGQDTLQRTSRDGSFCNKFWRNRKEYNSAIRWCKEFLLDEPEELSVSTSAGEEVKISMHIPQKKSKEKVEVEIVRLRKDTLETLRRRLGLLPDDQINKYLLSFDLDVL